MKQRQNAKVTQRRISVRSCIDNQDKREFPRGKGKRLNQYVCSINYITLEKTPRQEDMIPRLKDKEPEKNQTITYLLSTPVVLYCRAQSCSQQALIVVLIQMDHVHLSVSSGLHLITEGLLRNSVFHLYIHFLYKA